MIRYLAYPGDAGVHMSSQPASDPGWLMKTATGKAVRPFDVTPAPVAVVVHVALKEWRLHA